MSAFDKGRGRNTVTIPAVMKRIARGVAQCGREVRGLRRMGCFTYFMCADHIQIISAFVCEYSYECLIKEAMRAQWVPVWALLQQRPRSI